MRFFVVLVLVLSAWINPASAQTIAMAKLGGLYVILNQRLWYVNEFTGTWTLRTPASDPAPWKLEPIVMTAVGSYLYVIEGGRLHQVDPATGNYWLRDPPNEDTPWAGSPIAMAPCGSYLCVIQAGALWQVNPATGAYAMRVPSNDPTPWTGSIAMASNPTFDYYHVSIIQAEALWAADYRTGGYYPTDPSYDPTPWNVPPIFISRDNYYLQVWENGTLWRVDPQSGVYQPYPRWPSGTPDAMASGGGYTYLLMGWWLYRVGLDDGVITAYPVVAQ